MPQTVLQAKDILKTKNIIKGLPDETLSQALVRLRSSHDAVFVFDKKDNFLGLISPYYVIFKSKFPSETKVKHCLFSPPRLELTTLISEIAKLMIESKVYFLPVFGNQGNFEGIATYGRLFQAIRKNKSLVNQLVVATRKDIVSIPHNATLGKAFSTMRQKGVSRLPVVNQVNHLMGIVTRFDLREAFAKPRDSQRFLSRVGDKRKYLDKPISSFYKKMVVTANSDQTVDQLLETILSDNKGSVVIINRQREPVGIVSSHDILKAISQLGGKSEPIVETIFEGDFTNQRRAEEMLANFLAKIKKRHPITKAEFIFKVITNPSGKPSRFKVNLNIYLKNKIRATVEVIEYDWKLAIRKAIEKVRRQLE